jgi:hypothetical protein
MRHLWITPKEVSSSSYQKKEADAYAEDPSRQAAHGNGCRDSKDHHAGIVVVIENTFFRSDRPLKIICGEKEEN